jgi:hypothetical protein
VSRYAEGTSVSTETSRAEIERTLRRYKADGFMYGYEGERAVIAFRLSGRMIRFRLEMPNPKDRAFTLTPSTQKPRSAYAAEKAWEQACRQKWRALALVIKAKLEAVAAGITTVEDEFLAHTLLPDGSTVGDWAREQLTVTYERGQMPPLLPGPVS